MRIAVTSQGQDPSAEVDPRFGRARYFLIVDCATGQQSSVDNESGLNAAQGAGLQAVQKLADQKVQVVLTSHVGPKAWNALQAASIQAYTVNGGTVGEAIKAFLAGSLPLMNNASV